MKKSMSLGIAVESILKHPGMGFLPALVHLRFLLKYTHSLYIFKYALGSITAGQLPTLHAVRIYLPTNDSIITYYVSFGLPLAPIR